MNPRYFLIALFVGSLGLSGCQDKAEPQAHAEKPVPRNWLSLPALPLLQGAVVALAPKLENGLDAELMNQICGLARGESSQAQVDELLKKRGLDAAIHLHRSGPLALLVNGDRAGQATACAAHLASNAFSMAELEPFVSTSQEQRSEADQTSVAMLLSVKLAVARANADVLTLIASELQRRPGLNPLQVREQAQQLFSRLAPTYLARIRAQFPAPGTRFRVLELRKERLVFVTSEGDRLVLDHGALRLREQGALAYGEGHLHGLLRPLQVAYFTAEEGRLLSADEDSESAR